MARERIRIAYLIDSLRIGGTEKQLTDLVNRLDRKRFDPVIICIRESDADFLRNVHCEIREILIGSFKSYRFVAAVLQLIRFLRKRRIHIVQTFFIDASVFGVIGAKLAGVDRIISCRRDLGFWYDKRLLRVFSLVNRWVDCFWVNSEAVAQQLKLHERVSQRRIDVIYNGVDLELFDRVRRNRGSEGTTTEGETGPVVGIVANLNRQVKRVDVFIRAVASVAERCPRARFQIVGDGSLRPGLEALAMEVGVAERLVFLGSRTDVARILADFSVGVICSDSEGFSNSIIEYFAMGIPVVATDVGGNRELVDVDIDGFLVAKGDHQALAGKIAQLLKNDDRRIEMGTNGRRKVQQQYAWPVKIQAIEAYYCSQFDKVGP